MPIDRVLRSVAAGLVAWCTAAVLLAGPAVDAAATPTEPPTTIGAGTVPVEQPLVDQQPLDEAPDPPPGEPIVSGPTVVLDRSEVAPGDPLIVTLAGFRSRNVSMTICGNEARRGSADCNMRAGRAREIDPDSVTTQARYVVDTPPMPCPCLIRVSNSDQAEVGVAAVVLLGHPTAEPVDPAEPGPLVKVAVAAEPSSDGVLGKARASLGGAVRYAVTVRVTNLTTTRLDGLAATASARSASDGDLAEVPIGDPGSLEAGQTWVHTVDVELPAPRWGSATWTALVSGAGAAVSGEAITSNRPLALIVLIVVLVLDVVVLAVHRLRKRRRRAAQRRAAKRAVAPDEGVVVDIPLEPARQPELVGRP